MKLHFADMFAVEDMVSARVKGGATVATCALEPKWKARESKFALHIDCEGVIGGPLCGRALWQLMRGSVVC